MDKSTWVIGLLVFGLSTMAISFWVQNRSKQNRDALIRIGQVERSFGEVFTFRPGTELKRKVSKIEFISPLDSVETSDQSEARIALDNNGILRLLPESLVTFERLENKDGYRDVVVVQRGEIQVEDPGRDGELFVSKNGQQVAAKQYHHLAISKEPVAAAQSQARTDSKVGLSEDEINSLVGAQRGNFMKCYTSLLQKDPEAKGELSLNFTIENSGKVGLIEVNSSRLQNDDFRKCLSSVLSRVQFRSFSGSAISTFFPLKFE